VENKDFKDNEVNVSQN